MKETVQHKNNKNIVIGTIVLLIGGLLLLRNLGMIDFSLSPYLFTWKTFLLIIGLVFMASVRHFYTGVILTGLGVIFWIPAIFGYTFSLHQVFWPSLLVLMGTVLLMKAAGLRKKKDHPVEAVSNETRTTAAPAALLDPHINDINGQAQSENQ